MTGRSRRLGRRTMLGGWALLALTSSLGLSACSGVRNSLGTANSPCYVALPSATTAAHHAGTLAGVRLARVDSLRAHRLLYEVAGDGRAAGRRVCLVAFRGAFRAQAVSEPKGHPVGRFAVVVLSYPDDRLLGTIILRHVPLDFGHSHLF